MASFEEDLLFRVVDAEIGARRRCCRRSIERPLMIICLTHRPNSLLRHEIQARVAQFYCIQEKAPRGTNKRTDFDVRVLIFRAIGIKASWGATQKDPE